MHITVKMISSAKDLSASFFTIPVDVGHLWSARCHGHDFGGVDEVGMKYSVQVPLLANLDKLVHFDNDVNNFVP